MELKGMKIDFLGDSITFGYGLMEEKSRFADLLAAEYGITPVNHGISGTRIANQMTPSECADFDRTFLSRVPDLAADADAVLVFGGTNDYGHGDAPMGQMADRTPDTFYGALHCLYTALITRFPRAFIAVLTPLHRLNEDTPVNEWGLRRAGSLKDYVDAIREVAQYYSLPVLDLYRESGLQPCVPVIQQTYMPDGLHPNEAGHVLLKEKVAAFLKSH